MHIKLSDLVADIINMYIKKIFKATITGMLLFIAVSSLLDILSPGIQSVWISSPIGATRAWSAVIAIVFCLSAFWLYRRPSKKIRHIISIALILLLMRSIIDAAHYYHLLYVQQIETSIYIPMSLMLIFIMSYSLVKITSRKTAVAIPVQNWYISTLIPVLGISLGAGLLATGLLITFGGTNYTRITDCTVIMGAGVRNDGTPSLALLDRTNEGIRLYKSGKTKHLIMSGGIGRNKFSEPVVMRDIALKAGVPQEMIILDERGVNTRASAREVKTIMQQRSFQSVMVVSHYYHLLRCKEAFKKQGITCYTVGARMTRRLRAEPYFLLRECVAYIYYKIR